VSTSRRICFVTGTRAEYGLLAPLMRAVRAEPIFTLQLVVCGMHLSPQFGRTVGEIEADGFVVDARVENLLLGDSSVSMVKSVGLGVIGFADVFDRLNPDLVVLLGDRFEMLAAAQSAYIQNIPIAHLHGGEVTEGVIDEGIRHAITKMAWWHFVAAEPFRQRVIQLGESPERVFCVGAPGIDNALHMNKMPKPELEADLGIALKSPCLLVTHHPVTLMPGRAVSELTAVLDYIDKNKEVTAILTYPNADAEGLGMIRMLDDFAAQHPGRVRVSASLGVRRYLSLLSHVDVVIGNSSSALIEVPSFGKPSVNIGSRQSGRLSAESVIHCDGSRESIEAAVQKALSPGFQAFCKTVSNPFGDGHAVDRIMDIIRAASWPKNISKRFHDLAGMG